MASRPSDNNRNRNGARKGRRWFLLLLVVPFIVLLWPPFYNFREPMLAGFPFFYWFQLLWVVITAAITALVYWLDN